MYTYTYTYSHFSVCIESHVAHTQRSPKLFITHKLLSNHALFYSFFFSVLLVYVADC
jgi:hypothetical protein